MSGQHNRDAAAVRVDGPRCGKWTEEESDNAQIKLAGIEAIQSRI